MTRINIYSRHENLNFNKLFGVLISDDLKWNNLIDTVCNKVIPYCYVLNKTNKILNISVIKSIYYAHIFAHLKYSIVSWGSSPYANTKTGCLIYIRCQKINLM